MQVLAVASELYPLVKTGGLADVAGALPLALKHYRVSTKTLIPGYPAVIGKLRDVTIRLHFDDLLGASADIIETHIDGLDLLILDAPELFDRSGGPYADATGADHADNWRRLAALSLAAARIAAGEMDGWRPDLVHVHDWQAGLVPAYMRYSEAPELPSLITIHNIAFQGRFDAGILPHIGLPAHAYAIDGIEFYGGISYLKAGLQTSWAINTVSPTYAEEILTPEFGMGFEGLLAARAEHLSGIVNGIDTDVWDPRADAALPTHYSAATLKARSANKRVVEQRFGLDEGDGPLLCVVSRLTLQKGMDVLADLADEIVGMGARLAVLGTGDPSLEAELVAAAGRHPGRIAINRGYDEPLSHLMQAGSDAILIPSRFEPCGLTQLYGLRYGCVPVVSRTGGLNDTVIDANPAALSAGAATGVSFNAVTIDNLRRALKRTVGLYRNPKIWSGMQKQGMKSDVSWDRSAGLYAGLYAQLIANKG
ncbi:glycogen synthase GlgA [Neorhizobium sp. NPDC001467]|uniref:glycogen synthase GlgA n=1 Tax=Neorhizobium sp. NPDC001467 TaxID=3390595 RepID=UPI003D06C9EF